MKDLVVNKGKTRKGKKQQLETDKAKSKDRVVIPYIKGLSDNVATVKKNYGISVSLRSHNTLSIPKTITKTRLFKNMYIKNFTSKNRKFSDKNSDILHISAQNIDSGYSLEPPRRGGSNEYPQSFF